jgi:uncharacterized protein YabE (DUF348 family)
MNKRTLGFLAILFVLILAVVMGLVVIMTRQQVTVYADGQVTKIDTNQTNVAGALDDAGISLVHGDLVYPEPATPLDDGMEVVVERSQVVSVEVDGRVMTRRTTTKSISEFLTEMKVDLNENDLLIIDGEQTITSSDSQFSIQRRLLPEQIKIRRLMTLYVDDNGEDLAINTLESTVGQALQDAGIQIFLGDKVTPPLYTRIETGMDVSIKRSIPVSVNVDGQVIHTRTFSKNVADILAELNIALIGQDYVLPGLDEPLAADTSVRVVRVLEETITEQEPIPFDTIWQPDPYLEIDHEGVAQEGSPGVFQRRISVRYEDGQEVSRVLEDEWVAQEPTTHILSYGTMLVPRTMETSSGTIEYWRKIRVLATSYTAATSGKEADHPAYGITATGMPMGKGIVAVDPRIVNLYQKVYVENYGIGVAADTGGAIKGRRIDLGYDEDNLVLWYSWVDLYLLTPAPDPSKIRYHLGD